MERRQDQQPVHLKDSTVMSFCYKISNFKGFPESLYRYPGTYMYMYIKSPTMPSCPHVLMNLEMNMSQLINTCCFRHNGFVNR